jgi:hypothetical protein
MAGPKGIAAVQYLSRRAQGERGGQDKRPENFDRTASDALAWWRGAYLDALRVRN